MKWNEASTELESYIRPNTFPLAIRMLTSESEIPEKTKHPLRDLNVAIAVCQGIGMARRYGWTLAIGKEDINCPLTKIAFGFEKVVPYYSEGSCCEGMYTETKEAGAKTECETHRFEYGRYSHLLLGPAVRALFEPQVILVFGNPAQILRLVTGALWKRGGALKASYTGRLDCSDEVIRTILTGEYQVILPCYGDRIFGHTEDHEMAFTIPATRMPDLLEGLRRTQAGGIRYPIPTYLRYSGEFPKSYQRLETIWKENA